MRDVVTDHQFSLTERADQGHLQALDGLRGVAALLVMLGHSAYVYYDCRHPTGRILELVNELRRAGHPVVILFFALSGFVLYFAFLKRPDVRYGAFLVRRLFRLYPALIVSLLIALSLNLAQSPRPLPNLGAWTQNGWLINTDAVTVMRSMLLLGVSPRDNALDPVIWSLVIELRFSVIFILLALLVRRSRLAVILLSIAAYGAARFILERQGVTAPYQNGGGSVLSSLAVTAFYLPAFAFGIAAGDWMMRRRAPIRLPDWAQALLFVGLLIAGKLFNSDFVWCVVSTGLVAVACQKGLVARLLALPPCKVLGDISYSLYLVHFPILMALVYALSGRIGVVPTIFLSPVISLLVALIMHRYVELPGINLGKRAAAPFARPQPAPAGAAGL